MNTVPASLHCAVTGSGPDVVLLHPVGLDHTFMAPYVAGALRGYRLVALDLRGHGASPRVQPGTRLEHYVEDIRAAIARACAGPAVVLGLSFGGMLAQQLAITYPEMVAALVLCGCGGGIGPEARPAMRERGLAAERAGMVAVVEATVERWFNPEFRATTDVDRVRARLSTNDPAAWSAAWHAIATFDARERLCEIAVPTLMVAGERDVATPRAASAAVADAIPGARLAVLAGAPHMMQIECTELFGAEIARFLAARRA